MLNRVTKKAEFVLHRDIYEENISLYRSKRLKKNVYLARSLFVKHSVRASGNQIFAIFRASDDSL
ncbi:hypothetical protein ATN84_12305 [Paramesorhizobium deserti]|uniref:Uncharacterized protein n=1 Tax=Paramesorhizobium deserti TaxID=1494590 RepID=A0A135HUC2_9HYPH|nr:hypothetical protein ATN84_12305 [Paramesorhizobium deserti]